MVTRPNSIYVRPLPIGLLAPEKIALEAGSREPAPRRDPTRQHAADQEGRRVADLGQLDGRQLGHGRANDGRQARGARWPTLGAVWPAFRRRPLRGREVLMRARVVLAPLDLG